MLTTSIKAIALAALLSLGVQASDNEHEIDPPKPQKHLKLVYIDSTGPVLPYRESRCEVTAGYMTVNTKTIDLEGHTKQWQLKGQIRLNAKIFESLAQKVSGGTTTTKPGPTGTETHLYQLYLPGAESAITLKSTGPTMTEHTNEEARHLATFLDLICGESRSGLTLPARAE